MTIRRKKREVVQLSSALSDLAFILIIYFIVIAAFSLDKGFLVTLPAKDSTRMVQKDDILRFELDDSGALLFNEKKITLKDAEKTIALAVARHRDSAVLLNVAPRTPWQQVVLFVGLAERLHVETFSFKLKKEGA